MTSENNSVMINDWSIIGRIHIGQLHIASGEFVHVLGPNGAGKSSLLEGVAGLIPPSHGEVIILGRTIADWSLPELSHRRGFLGQQLWCQFELTVADIVGFSAEIKEFPRVIDDALEVSQLLALPLSQLSGGQQQRVHIARVLLQVWSALQVGGAILIFDEPLQRLDIVHQQSCLALLRNFTALGNTVIISSHDINLSYQFASSIALLNSGKLLYQGPSKQVLNVDSLKKTFECDFHLVYSENEYEFFHPKVNS